MNFGVSFQPNGFLLHIWLVGNGCSYCMPVICCMSGFLPRVAPPSSANITGPGPKLHELLVSALDAHHTSSLPVFLALWPFVAHLTCGARLSLPYARLDMPVPTSVSSLCRLRRHFIKERRIFFYPESHQPRKQKVRAKS